MSNPNRFIQLPNALFEGALAEMSSDGKMLYSLLMNRRSLSEKNNLTDAQGRTIVYFTNQEVCKRLQCGHDKVTKLFRELERYDLISRRKQGLGKPDLIYVNEIADSGKAVLLYPEKQKTRVSEISTTESENPAENDTDNSNTDQFLSYDDVEVKIQEQIEYSILSERNYGRVLDEIVSLLTDTYCTTESFVRISKRQISTQTFRARISKLTAEHIEYVIKTLEKNEGRIRNIRAYLLTALYNSIDTLEADSLYG